MKKLILFILAIHFSLSAAGVDKTRFDLEIPTLPKQASISGYGPNYVLMTNLRSEMSLATGGYFTLGTHSGVSELREDDACEISFGHPFAKTSHPVFSIDANWTRLDDYFSDATYLEPFQLKDTLFVRAVAADRFAFEFAIFANPSGEEMTLRQKITNLDRVTHYFGAGLVFDPALGKWGDGSLKPGNSFQQNDTLLFAAALPLLLCEKSVGAAGIQIEINADPAPAKIIVANWPEVYSSDSPDFSVSDLRLLYDLVLKFYWEEAELAPAASQTRAVSIRLLQPDFSNQVFLRCNLPSMLGMTNGLLFPDQIQMLLETTPMNGSVRNGMVEVFPPEKLILTQTQYYQSFSGSPQYADIVLSPQTDFRENVVTLAARFESNGEILDEIRRNIFMPASPKVDTGLVTFADSLVVENFPEVNLLFGLEVQATGQWIRDLQPKHIFLYENGSEITDFKFGHAGFEGSNLADIVFVLDCSGSMSNEIAQVRANLNEFADSLVIRGFDYQIGVVTFSTTVDDIWDFTNNIAQIRDNLASIILWGGVEDSPAALHQATLLSWRAHSRRNIIWITDEPYPETTYTQEQIVNRMLEMGIRVHGIGLTELQTNWFNPIVLPTGGNFYDINGNFRDILLDVANIDESYINSIIYTSPFVEPGTNDIQLEIHYGNRGVIKNYQYPVPTGSANQLLACFPNPFNPEVRLQIQTRDYIQGEIRIFNVLGQQVKSFSLTKNSLPEIVWRAENSAGQRVGSGVYLVQLSLVDRQRKIHHQTVKILHVK